VALVGEDLELGDRRSGPSERAARPAQRDPGGAGDVALELGDRRGGPAERAARPAVAECSHHRVAARATPLGDARSNPKKSH
jgi:hypothetical protein